MKFKTQQKLSQMPEVNLVPMMDVLLTVLTFFIIVSMTLSSQQRALDVTLPDTQNGANDVKTPDPLVVALDTQGKLGLQNKVVSEAELLQQMQTYLNQNPQGAVLLKADRQVSYEQLAKLLGTMQKIGGERVSLAIASD